MITPLGVVSLTDLLPLLVRFQDALNLSLGFSIPELQAKLAGLNNILLAIQIAPPQLTATIEAALATVASLQASIGGPTVTLQLPSILGLIAELQVTLAALTLAGHLSIPNASVSAYVFEGASATIGAELQSAIGDLPGGLTGTTHALILATTSSAAWDALGQVFDL